MVEWAFDLKVQRETAGSGDFRAARVCGCAVREVNRSPSTVSTCEDDRIRENHVLFVFFFFSCTY